MPGRENDKGSIVSVVSSLLKGVRGLPILLLEKGLPSSLHGGAVREGVPLPSLQEETGQEVLFS